MSDRPAPTCARCDQPSTHEVQLQGREAAWMLRPGDSTVYGKTLSHIHSIETVPVCNKHRLAWRHFYRKIQESMLLWATEDK